MTEYNRSEAYDLSLFDEPAIELAPKPQQRQVKPKVKKAPQTDSVPSASIKNILAVFLVSAMLLGLFGGIIAMRITLESLTSEAAQIKNQIAVAESENIRLSMQLSSDFSREKIEAYAVSQLGMCKLERYQIHYFSDRDDTDKVVVANGKAIESGGQNEVNAD